MVSLFNLDSGNEELIRINHGEEDSLCSHRKIYILVENVCYGNTQQGELIQSEVCLIKVNLLILWDHVALCKKWLKGKE